MHKHFNSIRFPIVIGHAFFAGLLLLLAWLGISYSFRPALEQIELEAATSLVERFKLEIQTEIQSVERLATDWAVWDDTYDFIENGTPQYKESNIVPAMYRNAGLNALAIYDLTGKVVFAGRYRPSSNRIDPLPEYDKGTIPDNFRFTLELDETDEYTGIWVFDGQLSLFAAKAVTDSNGETAPNGMLMMSMPLNTTMLKSIGEKLRVAISIQRIVHNMDAPAPDSIKITPASDTVTRVYTTLSDAAGTPQLLVELDMPRVLYGIGWKSMKNSIQVAFIGISILTFGLIIMTNHLVSRPLQELSKTVEAIGDEEYSEHLDKLPVDRNDEIGIVARSVQKMHERILFLANHDVLTHLPNRKVFATAYHKASTLQRRRTDRIGVLVLDLDGFKPINDTYGHPAGDQVLQEVARRLRNTTRETDIVARTGGDEFAILCVGIHVCEDLECVAKKVLQVSKDPITLDSGHQVSIGLSVGGRFVSDNANLNEVLSSADEALYEAKAAGKNTYRIISCKPA